MKYALKKYWPRFVIGLMILLLVEGHVIHRLPASALDRLDDALYDVKLKLTLPGGVDPRIVIVDINEKSLAEIGRWPWGRDQTARLTHQLFDKYGVKVAGFDVVFAEPDNSSGLQSLERLAATSLAGNAAFQRELARLRPQLDFDALFAAALKGNPVVLGYYFSNHSRATSTGALPQPTLRAHDLTAANPFAAFTAFGGNLPEFLHSAAGAGHFVPLVDSDGITRRVALLVKFEGNYYESLALAVARAWLGFPAIVPGYDQEAGANAFIESLHLKGAGFNLAIPVDAEVAALIPYRGRQGAFPYVSAADVIQGRVPVETLRGKIALVGTTAPGLFDLRSTPVGEIYPGVEIHANLIAGILAGNIKYKPWYLLGANFLLALMIGLVMALVVPLLSATRAALVSALMLLLAIGVNAVAWQNNIVLPLADCLVLIFVLFAINMAWGYLVEARSKRQLAGLFGQYVPPELVVEMSRDPKNYSMAGRREDLTVLFSDVRGFTTISEGLSAEDLAALMNQYLGAMTEVIRAHRGTLDKYIGDAIMAFWGAPVAEKDHAWLAVMSALEMQKALPALNDKLVARGWPALKIGIGINTGAMSVGDMGSKVRQSYTVMGDAVNLGSRLEGITKQYGVGIIIGEETCAQAGKLLVCRDLDWVRVKGKTRPVGIYEPLGRVGEIGADVLDELAHWRRALAAYRAQQWSDASRILTELVARAPHSLYRIYLEQRIPYLQTHSPGADWDGAWTFESK